MTRSRKFDRFQNPAPAQQLASVAAHRVCTYRDDDANEAAHHDSQTATKIVPTRIEDEINRRSRPDAQPDRSPGFKS